MAAKKENENDYSVTGLPNCDPETGQTIEENDDNHRSFNKERLKSVFKALDEIVKPSITKRDILQNRKYYRAFNVKQQKMRSGLSRADAWLRMSGDFISTQPDGAYAQNTGEVDRRPPTQPPKPFPVLVIKNAEDRSAAIKRIYGLIDKINNIINTKPPASSPIAEQGKMECEDSTIDKETFEHCLSDVINTPMY